MQETGRVWNQQIRPVILFTMEFPRSAVLEFTRFHVTRGNANDHFAHAGRGTNISHVLVTSKG
jgi:hypothetical protein